jgi:hypothetical protein
MVWVLLWWTVGVDADTAADEWKQVPGTFERERGFYRQV